MLQHKIIIALCSPSRLRSLHIYYHYCCCIKTQVK